MSDKSGETKCERIMDHAFICARFGVAGMAFGLAGAGLFAGLHGISFHPLTRSVTYRLATLNVFIAAGSGLTTLGSLGTLIAAHAAHDYLSNRRMEK